MFWIFKILPDLLWLILPVLGLCVYLLGHILIKTVYSSALKIAGVTIILISLFILGMLYADNTWQQEATKLQAKVLALEQQSQVINENIKEKIIVKTQVIKQRGAEITKYIDKEVVKYDNTCAIPAEFIEAHNKATTK